MRFRTRSLLILIALVAIALAVLIPFIREISRPTNSTYVVAASSDAGVNGYTFLDESQQVRLIVLEKLTADAKGKRGRNTEPGWLDYKMAQGRRIHIRINDQPVYFSEQITIYYAIDGGLPETMTVPRNAIVPYELPHVVWDRLIKR
jgi:hypothetical protein